MTISNSDFYRSDYLRAVDRLLSKAERISAAIGGLALLAIFVLIIAEVIARNVFNAPLLGMVDRVEWLLPFAASMGVAVAQANGEHFRMNIGLNAMSTKVRNLVEGASHICCAVFIWIVCGYALSSAYRSWRIGDTSPDIEWSLWPPKLAIGLVLALLGARLVAQCLGFLHALNTPLIAQEQSGEPL